MAKRSNPFSEDFVQQSKIHVGLKQFNNNEDRLKKVYEKTLELLFRGAKKQPVNESCENAKPEAVSNKNKMKQMFIGKNGTLLHSGTMIQNADVPVVKCACGSEFDLPCSYCEKALCSSCSQYCSSCDKYYCSLCSFTGSEGSKVCVSCYG